MIKSSRTQKFKDQQHTTATTLSKWRLQLTNNSLNASQSNVKYQIETAEKTSTHITTLNYITKTKTQFSTASTTMN